MNMFHRNLMYRRAVLFLFFVLLQAPVLLAQQEYTVGEGDVLTITVYGYDDLKSTVRVNDSGTIHVPLLGQIKVAGLTVPQISELIQKQYASGYLTDPQVNVFIDEFRSKKAVILGQVVKPGLYELTGATTLLELISKAGGLTEEAGETATVKRTPRNSGGANGETIVIDLQRLMEGGDLQQNIEIQDGDNVFITKAGKCYVTGEVKKPDAYKIDRNTTVIKAITLAGGFTGKAVRSKVKIVRVQDGEKKTLENVPLDARVYPDDIIIVLESFF